MESMAHKKLCRKDGIHVKLTQADILPFLVEEVMQSLDYMNAYKVRNVYEKLDEFVEKIKNIQNSYVNSI